MLLPYSVQAVWGVVTNLGEWQWHRDIRDIEVLSERQFIEKAKSGVNTRFTVTVNISHRRWAFLMENQNITGG